MRLSSKASRTSVIIPAYNCGDTLGRAAKSALEQDPAPLDVLVIDDGSTDNTLAVARGLGDAVTVIHQENAGPAAARNRGVQQARGEYIGFLDADDYWLPGFLQECQIFLDSQPMVVAVSVGLQFVKLNGKVRTLIPPNSHGNTSPGQPFLIDDFLSYWAEHDHIRTGSCLIRRSVLDRVGGQNVALRIAEDLELWGLLGTYGSWGAIPSVLWVCDSERAAARKGWIDKYRLRRGHCPSVEEWQRRILPRIESAQLPHFTRVRGRVAAFLVHNLVVTGKKSRALEIVQAFGDDMPRLWTTRLLRAGLRMGSLGWFVACELVRLKEWQKSVVTRMSS